MVIKTWEIAKYLWIQNRLEAYNFTESFVIKVSVLITAWKVSKFDVFSGPSFPVFGLRKIRTRKNSVFGHFSSSELGKVYTEKGNVVPGIL